MEIKRLREVEGWEQHVVEDIGLTFVKDNIEVLIRSRHIEVFKNHKLITEEYDFEEKNIEEILSKW